MTAGATVFQPLPQAPTAVRPAGLSADGAARSTWQPNVFGWAAVWRFIVVAQGYVALAVADAVGHDARALHLALGYALVTLALSFVRGRGSAPWPVLLVDLAACVALLAVAGSQATFALMALYSYSLVVTWAAKRPIDSFVAGGLAGAAYLVIGLVGPWAAQRPSAFVSNLALYLFFALATSGFFTVARRISALEIATEISRERGRYRRDLHDRLGQALCGLHFELQAVAASGVGDGVRDRLRSLADGYRDASKMLADLFRQNDEPLVATNVGSLIQQEARRLSTQSGARIVTTVDGEPARIPAWMRPHVWAIAGECMTNALKNGGAATIEIDLGISDGLLVLSVTDDGSGFDMPDGQLPDKSGHYGLREMQERARICGGEVVFASAAGFGTRVRLQVPLPEGADADLIERDASRLRENVWSLLTALRTGLGLVALVQLLLVWLVAGGHWAAGVLALVVAVDIALPVARSRALFAWLNAHPRRVHVSVFSYGLMFAVTLVLDIPPYFMLYAPVALLAAAVHGGRRMAAVGTLLFVAAVGVAVALAYLVGEVSAREVQSTLMHVTNMVIIGLSATQGAKLLDRLEALQIRVRYQALARLRQGLSSRMREQLVNGLDELETEARQLAEGSEPQPEAFTEVTGRLQEGSSNLKSALREIVHQLADPTPERTPTHV